MQTNIQWLSIEGGLAYLENHTGVIRWYGVHQLDNYRCHIGTKPLANTKVISTWSGPLNWLQMNVPDHRLDCFANNFLGPIAYKTYNLRITDPVVRGTHRWLAVPASGGSFVGGWFALMPSQCAMLPKWFAFGHMPMLGVMVVVKQKDLYLGYGTISDEMIPLIQAKAHWRHFPSVARL